MPSDMSYMHCLLTSLSQQIYEATFGLRRDVWTFLIKLMIEISDDSRLFFLALTSGYSGHIRYKPFWSFAEMHSELFNTEWTDHFKDTLKGAFLNLHEILCSHT